MRFVKYMIVVVLVASLAGNFLLYKKGKRDRVQASINNEQVTLRDWDDWLEQHHGKDALARMVRNKLVMQAAEKDKLSPDKAEVDELMQDLRETQPQVAERWKFLPWTEKDTREELEYAIAIANLRGKDVTVTDDELNEFFAAGKGKWNVPDKFRVKAVKVVNDAAADEAKQLMEKVNDMDIVSKQLYGRAILVGGDGSLTFGRPFGTPPGPTSPISAVYSLQPGQVTKLNLGNQGLIVVKLDKMEPGHAVTLADVRKKVEREFKSTRSKPEKEVLRKLWDEGSISTPDNPAQKDDIERLIFPEVAQQKAAQQ